MNNIAIVTDSNSGITLNQAKEWGVTVIPMPFYINGELYYEGQTLDNEKFYDFLEKDVEVKTSQPSPGVVIDIWEKLLEEKDYVLYIPMSSGLSSSCETASMLSEDYDGKVVVVNNRRISVTQLQSIKDAVKYANDGKTPLEIKKLLEETQYNSSIYILLDTLDFLKKGGRLTPAVASFAKVLNIKPVLQIQGEKLDAYKKVRGMKQGKRIMKEAMHNDLKDRFSKIPSMKLYAAYTGDEEIGQAWKKELEEDFPEFDIEVYPLSLSVSCHIGPGALAIACAEEL